MNKQEIIEGLHKIMCSATSTLSDSRVTNNDYFKRRVLGFRAEIEFENFLTQHNAKFLEGGQFISKKMSGTRENRNSFIYTTVSADDTSLYLDVYKTISNWDEVSDLFYIKLIDNDWGTEALEVKNENGIKEFQNILKPNFKFYVFDKNTKSFKESDTQDFTLILSHFGIRDRHPSIFQLRKRDQFNYFGDYDIQVLKKIYANRYFLDVILRKAQGRQVIDLDGFILTTGKTILVEIKEKSPITEGTDDINKWKYGWDSRRILWYLYLLNNIKLPVLYIVRQINNRDSRTFVQWDSIYISDFLRGISWSSSRSGGGGEDTLLAPYNYFDRLENYLGTNTISSL